jgi:hypothetical protein
MPPPQIPIHDVPYDLTGLDSSVLDAIEEEAKARGISFEDAVKQILIDRSRQLQSKQKRLIPSLIGRLFSNGRIH